MFKKTLLLIVLFVISLALFLVLLMPASVFWERVVEPNVEVNRLGVKVKGLEGTLFDGKALLDYQRIPVLLNWQLSGNGLLAGAVELDFTAELQAGEIVGDAKLGFAEHQLVLEKIDLSLGNFNQLKQLRQQRIKLDGELLGKDLSVTVADNQVVYASGVVSWSGGNISYPAGRQLRERALPSFRGDLGTREDGLIELNIRDAQGSFSVIEGSLLPEGLAQLQVRRRLLDLADEPWSKNSSEQDVVFKVKKSIY